MIKLWSRIAEPYRAVAREAEFTRAFGLNAWIPVGAAGGDEHQGEECC